MTEELKRALGAITKHTPGPWATHPNLARVDAFGSTGAEPVCGLVWPTRLRSEAETGANAYLIAAAPELLAVAKKISERLDAGEASADILAHHTIELNAAIAKAEGRTPALTQPRGDVA